MLEQIQEAPFTSWKTYFAEREATLATNGRTEAEDVLMEDDYLASLMNEDGIIQIGKYLFKIDVNQELVFALNEANKAAYADLVATNTKNEDIMIFSTNDEVLILLEEGSTGTFENGREAGLTCKQSQARHKWTAPVLHYGDGYRMVCRIEYLKFGVYFKLEARLWNQVQNLGLWWAQQGNLQISTNCGYQARCRSAEYVNDVKGEIDNSMKRVVYEKIKGLNKYYYSAQYSNVAAGVTSTVIEIRDNW